MLAPYELVTKSMEEAGGGGGGGALVDLADLQLDYIHPARDLVTSTFGGKTDIVHRLDFVSADSSVNISSLPLRCPLVPVS